MSTVIYTRAATEHPSGRTVTREQRVIVSPGRVVVRKFRDGAAQTAYHDDIRTRFPAFTAWRVGLVLRREGYVRRG